MPRTDSFVGLVYSYNIKEGLICTVEGETLNQCRLRALQMMKRNPDLRIVTITDSRHRVVGWQYPDEWMEKKQ